MYQYLGNTGINLYDLLNNFAVILIFVFNISNYTQKRAVPSSSTILFSKYLSTKKTSFFANINLWIFLEIILISFFQYLFPSFLGINWIAADVFGTGANYYGMLLFSPLFLQFLFLFLSVNPFKQLDLITPAYPLALISVKLACFFSGCCNGIECSFGLYNHDTELIEFPVQLVELALALTIFILLVATRKKVREGTLYPLYLILYSSTRFFSEFLRAEENIFWIFKRYHFICLFGVILGFLQLFLIKKHKDKIVEIYNKSCYVIIDFINVVLFGFEIRKGKKALHSKRSKRKKDEYQPLQNEVKFNFTNIRMWILVWTLGLVGQIGWNIEGTWFNTFVYSKIDKTPSIITPMLILSALATTVSILLFGTLTDITGNRRKLISNGYIVWGIFLMGFGLTQFLTKNYFSFAIVCVVIGDMFISFFASMSTDVGYSTWLTDIMNDKNKGQIGAAIAVQCVLGSLLGTVIGGKLVGGNDNYLKLFFIVGSCLIIFGVFSISLFTKKDDLKVFPKRKFSKQLFSGLNYKNVFKQRELLWVNIAVSIFFIGYNSYFPHLGNYLIDYLGYSPDAIGIIEAVPLILAMIVTIPASKYINNDKFVEMSIISIVSGLAGSFFIYKLTPNSIDVSRNFNLRIFFGFFLVGVSYIIMLQTTKVWTKKLYPAENKGQYEVLWAIAYALVPMILGSNIGEFIIKHTGLSFVNEFTLRNEYIPKGNLFLIGTLISTLSLIPIMITKKYKNKHTLKSESTIKQ